MGMTTGSRTLLTLCGAALVALAGCGDSRSAPSSAAGRSPAPAAPGTASATTAASVAPSPSPSPSSPVNPSSLAQVLHLPTVAKGDHCPHSVLRVMNSGLPPALGPGPINPTGPFTDGVLRTTAMGSALVAQIVWISAPSYPGPALVRGQALDGPGAVRFGAGSVPSAGQLRLPPGGGTSVAAAPGWRTWSIVISMPRPGCYGFQIDGIGFSTVVLFEAK